MGIYQRGHDSMISDNHIAMVSQNDIAQICAPLFAASPLKTFIYLRCYDNGEVTILTSDNRWIPIFFEKEYMITTPVPTSILDEKFTYLLSAEGPYSAAYKEAKALFGIDTAFDIITRKQGYYEMLCFASDKNDADTINFYFNNMDLLETFGLYFKEKARSLLKKGFETPLIIPKSMHPNFGGLEDTPNAHPHNLQSALTTIMDSTGYNIELNGQDVRLYKREVQCLCLLVKGYNARTSADILNVSQKTVESYIASAKLKLNCQTKNELRKSVV